MPNVLGQNRRTLYLDEDPESAQGDIFRGLSQQITGVRADQREQEKRKESVEDAVALMKAKMPLERESEKQKQRDIGTEKIRQLKAEQRYKPDYAGVKNILGTKKLAQEMEDKRRIRAMSGLEEPSEAEISSIAAMPKFRRNVLGKAGGGNVITPEGATFNEGEILSPIGQRVGEYLEGYEPKETAQIPPTSEEVAGEMRTKFAPGISKEELSRKALGLPRFTGRATEGQVYKAAKDLALAENPLASEKEIQAKIPIAQKMMKRTATFGQGIIDTTAAENMGGELPDASQYEEGTIYEDDNGKQYKIENGEWAEL